MRIKLINMAMVVFTMTSSSCVDAISFETNSANHQLVFYGTFSQLNETHVFNISQTNNFGMPGIPISGAVITIHDDLGNSAVYAETDDGSYQLKAEQLEGVPQRSYHVEILLTDGRSFTSVPQQMPEPIDPTDIYFDIETREILSGSDIIVDQTFIDIYLNTPIQNSSGLSSGLRWEIEEVYSFTDLACHPYFDPAITCYFNVPIDGSQVKIFSSEDGVQKSLTAFKVHSRLLAPDDEFVERHYFSVYQYTLSQEVYNYWEKVKLVANQSGSILDTQPATIVGNIHEKEKPDNFQLGYFEVNGKSVKRIYTLPLLIKGNRIIETCPESRSFIIDDKCCFCWQLDEAENSIERPEYWGN